LITDIDGTISAIVSRPEDATVDPAVAAALDVLASRLDLVAIITARDGVTARRMVGAKHAVYVGNYGLAAGTAVAGVDAVSRARSQVGPMLSTLPCVTVEDKGVAFSLHYRNCDDSDGVRLRLLEIARPLATAANARILEGKRVIELVPGQLPDKRKAFLDLLDERAVRALVYLGDDLSDIPVFEEIAARRRRGKLEGVGIAVVDAETDASVAAAADVLVEGVAAAVQLLTSLAALLTESGGET
jgi:trehalose 6-phosphate phosphatase